MKILVVEDNVKLAQSVQKGLQQEGYVVDVVNDGMQAMSRIVAFQKDYDTIVLDIMLPGKDGISICCELREQNITVPIILLTAKDTTADKVKGLDAGADDYLIKPFSFEELVARVRALLRRPKEILPEILHADGIELDTKNKTVVVNGTTIALTLREFNILEFLMRHVGQVVTREQLIAHLWDYSFDGMSNVIDVHIKNVRKKLGNHENCITTLRGLGYKFEE